ncbi:MAG: hypothetical protein NZM12_10225 [Steroidobacteraceae bacterium]|nr:hypothetical protein [Steroidobacteraceae bacterium]MDW8260403.1 hypothetical protein [Gammaproteobacteria bacterium]
MANDPPAPAAPTVPLSAPIIDREPDFLTALPMDNAVGAIVALAAEVYLLRERLHALEAELTRRDVLPADAVERHEPSPQERQRRQEDLDAFTQRILSELTRDRTPVSRIDPGVTKFLQPAAKEPPR